MNDPTGIRTALARLTPDERAVLAERWTSNARKWAGTAPAMGHLWDRLATVVHEVDAAERIRLQGLQHAGSYSRASGRQA
ncbi:hypothetical protein [Actinomadura sp. BRA 177]|uniref:hypothetical protein n=1 Tax=Actinomadura sp. BRA 177 TaxID=2745202 RepID=UPI001595EC3B|nr:hypothetical protein [Actinomadura sp. BRA 177]NVI88237.1 hypothetical protein [Actinomadura sp. BRA 177]